MKVGIERLPRSRRYLCICADDFGMSEGINAAVIELVHRNKISATSCMVHRAAWAMGVSSLREISPACVDVGLHLDLGRPLQGRHSESSLGALIIRSHLGLLRPEAVRAEVREQLTRFEDGLGRAPAFVDGHRHVHQLPVVRDVLTEEIADRYGAALPWIRSTAPLEPRRIARTKADIIFALGGPKLLVLTTRHAIPTSRGLLGVYDFAGSAESYLRRLHRWIGQCRTGDVLMCHPSLGEPPTVPHGAARLNEYVALSAITFPVEADSDTVLLSPLSRQT